VRLKLISCEIFFREMCAAIASSRNRIDIEFLPKGLHDIGTAGMNARLRDAIDRVDESSYDAVLLGYGCCNNAVVGLESRSIPLVIPRAHDCITLLLGSKERYAEYFHANPGVYFKSTGWIERNDRGDLRQLSIQEKTGMDLSYEELVAKYGEDNAKFLFEQLCDTTRNYRRITFIEMGIEPDDRFERGAEADANSKGWEYEKVVGDLSLIRRFLDGDWTEDAFLVVPPGHRVTTSHDERIVELDPRIG